MGIDDPEVDFTNSALIVWDMQYGIASRAFNLAEVTANVNLLIGAARRAHKPVIFTQHTAVPHEYLNKYGRYSLRRRGVDPSKGSFMAEGTQEWQLISEISPAKEDLVLKKHTPSFFIGTMGELLLRSRGVDTIVLTGVSTEIGIEATARHAAYLGFIPVVVGDAIGSSDKVRHETALKIMDLMFPILKTDDVSKSLAAGSRSQ